MLRRDFIKSIGLAAPFILGRASAATVKLRSPKDAEISELKPNHHSRLKPKLIKPARLRTGDTVGIVAPASPLTDPDSAKRYLATLQKLGFKPRLAPNALKRLGYLAGTDKDRAKDLMGMFRDPAVKAIFCLRGGYGSARLLELLDYDFIAKHPKILVGFSDITSLLCALLTRAGLVTFHGPTLNTSLTSNTPSAFTVRLLLRTVMEPSAPGSICDGKSDSGISVLNRGLATGELIGGNLSVLCATVGTPFLPSFQDRILFLEDVDEEPYRFDRMLTQLLNAGLLRQLAGIAIGTNAGCNDPKAARTKEYRQTLLDVLKDRLGSLGVPVVVGLPFGHMRRNATLPVGIRATLDGNRGDLIVEEPAVV